MERELTILLVEDDTQACEEIVSYADDLNDVAIVDITNNAPNAVKSVRDYLPDAVILDLELHGGGGSGVLAPRRFRLLGISVLCFSHSYSKESNGTHYN